MRTFRVICADVLDGLRSISDGSVRCCVTSPPYWGLRDYQTAKWDGGDPDCDHDQRRRENDKESKSSTSAGQTRDSVAGRFACRKCGARRIDHQIGLERTPEEYVAKLVEVFREVRRVLTDDGTIWLNLGDSYAGSGKGGNPEPGKQATNAGSQTVGTTYGIGKTAREAAVTNVSRRFTAQHEEIKPKDLVGIPWRVAFALQSDGWWLRQDIIWAKPNPMPESVTDRCTKAHEYVFLLSKAARYYYDSEAVKEGDAVYVRKGTGGGHKLTQQEGYKGIAGGTLKRDPTEPYGFSRDITTIGRNRRSVWNIATQPFPGAHFAVMPEALVEPCILAGSAVGDTVLDPFAGSGTVGVVALRHGREFVGIELNPEYAAMAEERIRSDAPLWNELRAEGDMG